jgi:hypothetical protein
MLKWMVGGLAVVALGFSQVEAVEDDPSNTWLLRRDFVKFGKKEAYEEGQKWVAEQFFSIVKKRDAFPSYAIQILDSPEYLYLTSVGTIEEINPWMKQRKTLKSSSPDWEIKKLERSSSINFFFRSIEQYLPQCSCIPPGAERFNALPFVYLYWIEVVPGQESIFEGHLSNLAGKNLKEKSSLCWRVWREFSGGALPQYLIILFAPTEKAIEDAVKKIEFIPGSYKQILRKQTEAKGIIRTDLDLSSR